MLLLFFFFFFDLSKSQSVVAINTPGNFLLNHGNIYISDTIFTLSILLTIINLYFILLASFTLLKAETSYPVV